MGCGLPAQTQPSRSGAGVGSCGPGRGSGLLEVMWLVGSRVGVELSFP